MEIEARIGNRNMYLFVSEKLGNMIWRTNSEVNYKKRIAKMRRCYHGEIYYDIVLFSPSFVFALEETLEDARYYDELHNAFLSSNKRKRRMFYTLFREGKSIYCLMRRYGYSEDEIVDAVQKLFLQLSKKIK